MEVRDPSLVESFSWHQCYIHQITFLQLPLSKYADCLHPGEIRPLLLLFRDKSWEKPYLKEYDPLFKFYILATFVIFVASFIILLLTEGKFL